MHSATPLSKSMPEDAFARTKPAKARLASIKDATIYAATSRAKLYSEWKAGKLEFIKIDGATRVEFSELDRWINAKISEAALSVVRVFGTNGCVN